MAELILYDRNFMDEISKKYTLAEGEIDAMIAAMSKAKLYYSTCYYGQANTMAANVFSKIIEHLKLLKACCGNAGSYVQYQKNEMIKADAECFS